MGFLSRLFGSNDNQEPDYWNSPNWELVDVAVDDNPRQDVESYAKLDKTFCLHFRHKPTGIVERVYRVKFDDEDLKRARERHISAFNLFEDYE